MKPYMQVGIGLWALDRGAGMTGLNLLDALVVHLQVIFRDYELKAKSGLMQNVKVFAQYLPQPKAVTVKPKKDSENIEPQGYTTTDIESNFPCVIVKLDEETDREEDTLTQTRVNVRILVGTYDKSLNETYNTTLDCQGYRDVLNIIETIRQELLTLPGRVLADRYRLEMPLKSYLFEEQTWPIYFGQVESVWETGWPLMPRNFGRC